MNEQRQTQLDAALSAATLPVQAGHNGSVVLPKTEGSLLRRIVNSEERRHFEVQQIVEHVAVEVLQAQQAMGFIATDAFAVGVEFEAQSEQLLHEYEDSQLALSAAPAYLSMSRQLLMKGVAEVSQAGFGHISKKIARR